MFSRRSNYFFNSWAACGWGSKHERLCNVKLMVQWNNKKKQDIHLCYFLGVTLSNLLNIWSVSYQSAVDNQAYLQKFYGLNNRTMPGPYFLVWSWPPSVNTASYITQKLVNNAGGPQPCLKNIQMQRHRRAKTQKVMGSRQKEFQGLAQPALEVVMS